MKSLVCVFLFSAAAAPSFGENIFQSTFPIPVTVAVPVANVRAKPIDYAATYEFDSLQETQVEQDDPIVVYEIKDGWARVECPHQQEFTHNNQWQGYPGWIKLSDLSTNTVRSQQLSPPRTDDGNIRQKIIHKAYMHLNNPYLWGGRSLHNLSNATVATGVDCSGLINWAYKEMGLTIPRDAHEQYMASRRINPLTLMPGDLIFLAKKDSPKKIVHVLLYTGEGDVLEAPQTGENVRRISIKERFGKSLSQLNQGSAITDNVIYFGSFFGASE